MTQQEFVELRWLVHWDRRRRAEEDRRVREAAACEGKDAFDSFTAANRTISTRLRRYSHVYQCAVCHKWHIGGRQLDRHRRIEWHEKKESSK